MTRPSPLLIACVVLALAGCKKDNSAEATTPKAEVAGPGSKAAQAEADKAGTVALELCNKALDVAAWSDMKKHSDKLVAVFSHPRDPGFDFTKDGDFAWVATKAAVVRADDEYLTITLVADDTDPCAIDQDMDLLTSKKNPAARINLEGTKPGDYSSWFPGAEGLKANLSFGSTKEGKYVQNSFDGPTYFRVSTITAGKSVELDIHGCESQIGGLMGTKPKHFAIGHVVATWCPQKT